MTKIQDSLISAGSVSLNVLGLSTLLLFAMTGEMVDYTYLSQACRVVCCILLDAPESN